MCEICDIQVNSSLQAYNYDPTRTTTLRNSFVADMRRRFKKVTKLVTESVVKNDCFGLKKDTIQTFQAATKGQFDYPTNEKKVAEFMKWFNSQVDEGILEYGELNQLGVSINNAWTNKYIFDSYKRGLQRARYELNNIGISIPTDGLEIAMGTPIHLETLGVLYARTFNSLNGITDAMDRQISIILAQGLADGDNPTLLAKKLNSTILGENLGELGITDSLGRFVPALRRAETLARTEIIRAHHLSNINEYMNWRVEGVYVKAELMTAGDNQVCNVCADLEGETFTLERAKTLIPVHPNCRCIALPYIDNKK